MPVPHAQRADVDPRFVEIGDFMWRYQCSRSTVFRLIKEGKLTRIRVGKTILLTQDSVNTYLDSLSSA